MTATETQLNEEVTRLNTWVQDLQSNMYVNCVYCGHRYGPEADTPVSMADVLKQHVMQCREHPMHVMRESLEHIRVMMRLASISNVELKPGSEIWTEIAGALDRALTE